ncbi:MAG: hypothetical protein JJE51_13100 [Thermoanaerobaculia bacterium]|nr:hypothetical protein [Thermoanaerobaculia bacterium]
MSRFRIEFGRWWYNRIHRISRRKVTWPETVSQAVLAFVYLSPLLLTNALTWDEKRGPAIWLTLIYVFFQLIRQYRELEPQAWDDAREHYIDRKHEFAKVIRRLSSGDPAKLDHAYQRDCLWLIANYLRSWRWDLREKHIFASLLVEEPSDPQYVTVIARDREERTDARDVPKRYLKSERLISECFETGKYCEISNLRLESPYPVANDCPYKSILGLPLKNASGKVIAIVSIDSSLPYHFAMEGDLLEVKLQPYLVALLPSVELYRESK